MAGFFYSTIECKGIFEKKTQESCESNELDKKKSLMIPISKNSL
jgi:hypothetical protein